MLGLTLYAYATIRATRLLARAWAACASPGPERGPAPGIHVESVWHLCAHAPLAADHDKTLLLSSTVSGSVQMSHLLI